MMQVFRLMGMPDKVIAFENLPPDLLKGFELLPADGFPRHWKEWMGKTERHIIIPPEKDFLTGQVRRFEPIVEKDCFFYIVDWMVQPVVEKWEKVCEYAKQNVEKDFRLTDKLEEMAKPLAPDKLSAITLEPEEVIVIPLPALDEAKPLLAPVKKDSYTAKCEEPGCAAEYEGPYGKNALRMHKMKKHVKEKVA